MRLPIQKTKPPSPTNLIPVSNILDPSLTPVGNGKLPKDSRFYRLQRDGVTQGLLGRFMACPEKHNLGTVQGLGPVRTSGALAFGSLVHEVLDRIYSLQREAWVSGTLETYQPTELIAPIMEEMEQRDRSLLQLTNLTSALALQDLELNYGMADLIIRHYFDHWKRDRMEFDWQALEQIFSVPYSYQHPSYGSLSIPVRGKFDGIFRTKNGELWLFETKTKARIEDETIVDKLPFDLQVCLYIWAAQQVYDSPLNGVVYNLIRRPQLRKKQSDTLRSFLDRIDEDISSRRTFYFVRYQAYIPREDMQEWVRDFNGIMEQLIQWTLGVYHYRNSQSCTGRYGSCEFLRKCSSGDMMGLHKREQVFPELEEEREGLGA